MPEKTFHSLTLPGMPTSRVPLTAIEFNTDTAYAIRDYCTYQGKLYKCIVTHAAGAWDTAHFTETNIDNELDEKLMIPPYQASAPSNPKVGDLWVDSDENSPIYNVDSQPMANSTNAVQSGGVYTTIKNIDDRKGNRSLFSGDYSASATYEVNQLVMNGQQMYRCTTRIATPEAWNATHWTATNLNTEFDRLRTSEADIDMIAENYGDSSSYTVGDYVIHNSGLFRCISEVNNTGNWDPDDWSQVKLADEISDLKSAIDASAVEPLEAYELHNGNPMNTGKWGNINANYQHMIVPIKSGDVIKLTAASKSLYYAVLKSYTTPVSGASVPYSDVTGWTDKATIAASATLECTAPSDAKYLLLEVNFNDSFASFPASLVINGSEYVGSFRFVTESSIKALQNQIDAINAVPLSARVSYIGFPSQNNTWINKGGNYKFKVIPVNPGASVDVIGNARTGYIGALTSFFGIVPLNDPIPYSADSNWNARVSITANQEYSFTLPSDAHYLFVQTLYNSLDCTPAHLAIDGFDYTKSVYDAVSGVLDVLHPGVNWCAMGDSICEGFVSYMDGDDPTYRVDRVNAWAYVLARKNNWSLTNIAIGGTGWNKATNAQVQEGVDTTSAHYIARHTDFTPYNLVTLAYGINDWKGNRVTGTLEDSYETPTTTIGGMRATIEAILTSNPHCKIIVILPLNCVGYDFNLGNQSTNWGLGYSFANSGTLEAFVQALISVCDYYGIQYIDMAHYSCVNRYNLLDCLTDGVHPNEETHEILARELCRKITFG